MERKIASSIIGTLVALILICLPAAKKPTLVPVDPHVNMDRLYPDPAVQCFNPAWEFEGKPDEEEELRNVQVPIPMKDRVFNRTGIQCVWCSLECLGRWAEEPKLIGMTNLPDCRGYSSPGSAAFKLGELKVKFEQTTSKQAGRELIRKAVVKERRGVLFSIPGHAMNLIHYDENKRIVKYINNSDRSLKVRTWTMDEFEKRWEGWICAIYADDDIVPMKFSPPAQLIPIVDRMGGQLFDPKKYILIPGQ